jgi:FtsP/CotA-like multicopper oxidase with cupredoxin domain
MKTQTRFSRLSTALLLVALLISVVSINGAALADTLPATTCTATGPGAVTCELWAKTGTLSLPGNVTVPIWGYANTAAGAAQIPGPVLIVNQGDAVTVILHNSLTVTTSLKFEGQSLPTDRVGAAPGVQATYVFTATKPGTFLYEAGPLAGAQYQAALGLHGALIVRPPAVNQAYNNAASAYEDEALVALTEIDTTLNNAANPATFDMRKFKPRYWLINGKAYTQTVPIGTLAGNRVLLRYVNGGQQPHTMALLGLSQNFLALAGEELPAYRRSASQLLMPGQSADAIVTIPASAPSNTKFALYDAGMLLHNNGGQAFGGMLTFLEIAGTPGTGDTQGPAASGLSLSANPINGTTGVTLTATISDIGRGDAVIQAAEYCIDVTGASCTPSPMNPVNAPFDSATESVQATLSTALLGSLAGGNHTLYVRGQDVVGNWGSYNTIVLVLDTQGPATTGITLNPAVSNGSLSVAIQATGNDSASGGSDVIAAEYFIDTIGVTGTGTVLMPNAPSPIASLTGSISAATVNALSVGNHPVYVHSRDALGNWGGFASATLTVDQTGPTTSNVRTTPPEATNATSSVRVDALVSDTSSKIVAAELFIDTVAAPGTGLGLYSTDGLYDELTEDVYGFVPQAQVNALSAGSHTIHVRGKDAAGNWGTTMTVTLISDKVVPTLSGVAAAPTPTNSGASNNSTFTLSATANGTGSRVIYAEWYEGADPGPGQANAFTFTPANTVNLSAVIDYVARGWAVGNHTVSLRVRDAASNWSTVSSVVVNVVYPNNVFADGFESGSFSAWSTTGGTIGNISVTSGAAQAGTYQMAAVISGGVSGYVQDNTPFGDATYHARFYVNPGTLAYTNNGVANTERTIFLGLSPTGGNVFTVQIHRTSTTGSFQVRAQVFRAGGGGGVSTTNWFTIPGNVYTAVEIDWISATSAAFRFYTGGTLRQTFTGINTSAFKLDTVRLGPQGSWTNATGTMYFDSFVSTRRTYIGP